MLQGKVIGRAERRAFFTVIMIKGDTNTNKLAINTRFLNAIKNRYLIYQEDNLLGNKTAMAAETKGREGLKLCCPQNFSDSATLKIKRIAQTKESWCISY
ncbi:MAG: hypothetical protein SNJ71_01995 [Bacteroidales bacterium]